VLDQQNPYTYIEVRGTAVEARGDDAAHIDRLAKKYLGVDVYPRHSPDEPRQRFVIDAQTIRYRAAH
jgi:hypothetical protein